MPGAVILAIVLAVIAAVLVELAKRPFRNAWAWALPRDVASVECQPADVGGRPAVNPTTARRPRITGEPWGADCPVQRL